jgi:hypothetical protein
MQGKILLHLFNLIVDIVVVVLLFQEPSSWAKVMAIIGWGLIALYQVGDIFETINNDKAS